MTDAVAGFVAERTNTATRALSAAVTFWFAVTVIGQGAFLYYILGFYGPSTVSGNFADWNRHPIASGYVAGDILGNLSFAAHVMLAAMIALGGTLQLIPQIRARAIAFHRWNGRVFLFASILAAGAGAAIIAMRGPSSGGSIGTVAIMLNAALVLGFGGLAYHAARTKRIGEHRRWALRTFMVVNGVFFLRLMFSGWLVLTQSNPGVLFYVFSFASYLLPLALLEFYFFAKERGGPGVRLAAAGAISLSALYMAAGVFGFTMMFVVGVLYS